MKIEDELFANAYQFQHEGHLAQAIVLYEQIIHQNPKHTNALHCLALAHAQLGHMSKAIPLFQEAIALTPTDPGLYNNLANAYKKNHQLEQAMEHYQKAISLAPDYAQAQNNLAGIYAMKGLYKPALTHYRLAIHAEPDFAAAHFNLGLLLATHHQLEAASTQFKNVLALNPDHIEALFYLGVLNLEAEQYLEAERAFQKIVTLDSNHVETLTNLGVVALKQKQGQVAIDYFSKALALNNDHIEARNNIAATFMHYDRFENALMHYDVLLRKEPNNIEYLYNSGVAQMALGHLKEAINHFEHLIQLNPDHFAALNNLAAIFIRQEDKTKAQVLLERATTANPNDKASQHMLRALSGSIEKAPTCPDYVENLFNNYALYYDQHLKKYLQYAIPNHIVRVLDELSITNVDSTLELGSGTGLTGQVLRDVSTHLTGIDIAEKMIEQAQDKGIYDELVHAEIEHFFKKTSNPYHLIVAADVLPYFGDLDALFKQVTAHLSAGGYFIFTTEISSREPWQLNPSARFSHHPNYLKQLADNYGLIDKFNQEVVARHQEGKELLVLLIALQLPK